MAAPAAAASPSASRPKAAPGAAVAPFDLRRAHFRTLFHESDPDQYRSQFCLLPNGTDVLCLIEKEVKQFGSIVGTSKPAVYRFSLLDPCDDDGRPKLRPVFGQQDAPRAIVDGSAADARFHTPSCLVLRTDSAGQPLVLVGDYACIRMLRGEAIGGMGSSRVDTLGGPKILNLRVEMQALDITRVLIQHQTTGEKKTAYRHHILDTTNLEQPQLLPVVSNTKPNLPLDLAPFLHILPRKQFTDVHMLAPGLWLHVVHQRDQMTKSCVFPYFPAERRVDQTNYDGVEITFTNTEDDEEKAVGFTVVAHNRVLISFPAHFGQADVKPTYGADGSLQLCELRLNARTKQGQVRDGNLSDARTSNPFEETSISPHAVIIRDGTFMRLIYMGKKFCAGRPDLERALQAPLQEKLQRLMEGVQPGAPAAAPAAPAAPGETSAAAAPAAAAAPGTVAVPAESPASRKRKSDEAADDEEPQSARLDAAGPAHPAATASIAVSSAAAVLPSRKRLRKNAAAAVDEDEPSSAQPEVAAAPAAAAAASPASGPSPNLPASSLAPAPVAAAVGQPVTRPRAAPRVRRAPRVPRRSALAAISPRENVVIQLEEELEVDDDSDEVLTVATSGASSSESGWLSRYRAAADEVRSISGSDVSTVRVALPVPSGPISGIIFVANDTWQQHRPAGFLHRYECGFTTLPEARLRSFFTHNLDTRWLLTVPVLDVLAANRAALFTLRAAGADIIPGRIKWFTMPPLQVDAAAAESKEAEEDGAAPVFVNVTTRMILDWIRSAVQPWRDRSQPVAYNAGPAQSVQNQLLANYNIDRLGRHQGGAPAVPAPAAPAAAPVAAAPAAGGAAPAVPVPAAIGAHRPASSVVVSSAPVLLRGAALRAAVESVEADVADALPAGAPRRRFRHSVSYHDDGDDDSDGGDDDANNDGDGAADMEIDK